MTAIMIGLLPTGGSGRAGCNNVDVAVNVN